MARTGPAPERDRARLPSVVTIDAMARFLSIVLLLHVSLVVCALVDCLSAEDKAVRTLPRAAWIFLIILTSPIGALAWFVAGQPAPAVRSRHGQVVRAAGPDRRRPRPARPLGPEDDPAFIEGLAAALRGKDSE